MPLQGFEPPKRGVGLVYSPLLHDWFLDNADVVDVAEIEPQTAWIADDPLAGPFRQVADIETLWRELPQHKLLHSVAMPLAGLRRPVVAQMELLRRLASSLGCAYVSEHLSVGGTPHQNAGFLLPPRQTWAGVRNATTNIAALKQGLDLQVAVETGVSYLPAYEDEIPDGDYVRAVAEGADCGILFDIHNAYCNEKNGRQRLARFAAALPADRVWELHIAGGFERDGYWLDAHSGEPPAELVSAAREIVRGLPNLSAIIFEVYPSFLNSESAPVLHRSLDVLHGLWADAGKARGDGDPRPAIRDAATEQPDDLSAWESNLTTAIRFKLPAVFGDDLSLPPAIGLYHDLAHSFRASSLMRLVPRTLQYIAMAPALAELETLVRSYEEDTAPPLFALNEARSFRAWLAQRMPEATILVALCDYEIALLQVPLTGQPVVVHFGGDPQPLFQALSDGGALPGSLAGPRWEIEITPRAGEAGANTMMS